MSSVIELKDLSVRLGRREILQQISCRLGTAGTGKAIGLLGPNGAGKSTLIRTLLGFHRPSHGAASVLGHDCHRQSRAVKARVGYMPENESLIANLTAVSFLRLMGEISGLPAEVALEKAHEVLYHVGLGESRYRTLGTYSLGMKQMAKFAQAIVHGPELLILDEPTNGLDPAAREEMLALARGYVPSGDFRLAPAEALPFDSGAFDLVFLGRMLHETADRVAALKEARRVARQRVAVLEWPYLSEEHGPPLEDRLSSDSMAELARLAGFARKPDVMPLAHMVLYRLDS